MKKHNDFVEFGLKPIGWVLLGSGLAMLFVKILISL